MKKSIDPRIAQIIDANLDRAREGLRVLEDWARFGLCRDDIVREIKDYRQILGRHHLTEYKQARSYQPDICIGLSHPEQFKRIKTEEIISSNSSRVQEALRVIEEFARNKNNELALAASKIRYEIYQLEIQLLRANEKNIRLKKLTNNNLYYITSNHKEVINQVQLMLNCGVRIVQYRFKSGNDSYNINNAIKIRKLCIEHEALFIVNDRLDIALASDADGLHLGQDDLDINHARGILGPTKIIGISASNEIDIKKAIKDGADYLGIGPIFESSTKENKIPLGIEKIKSLTKEISIPWFAIGGINSSNISILKKINITKVAMISDLNSSENSKEKAIMVIKTLSNEN